MKIKKEKNENDDFKTITKKIENSGNKKVVIFSHDDPDGITSAIMLNRLLKKIGAVVEVKFPEGFVLTSEQAAEMGENTDLMFILDKGTFKSYDQFSGSAKKVIIIDHHPPGDLPEKALFYNPSKYEYTRCSNSAVIRRFIETINTADVWDDFYSLMGLTGDFAVNSVTEEYAEFDSEFVKRMRENFKNLFQPTVQRPTMFEVEQREKTSLLHQLTEVVHAVSGGGFQFFYSERDPRLQDIDPPTYIFKQLSSLMNSGEDPKSWESVDQFIAALPNPEPGRLMYDFYLQDWDYYSQLIDAVIPLAKIRDEEIFLFCCENFKLGPMIAPVKLHELHRNRQFKEALIIMYNIKADQDRFSFRTFPGSKTVDADLLARQLTQNLKQIDSSGNIAGGGHPVASECTVVSDKLTPKDTLKALFEEIEKLKSALEK